MLRRNVLMVAGVFPPGVGGMQNYFYNLCKYSKHNLTVLASHYDDAEAFDRQQTFRVVRRPFLVNEKIRPLHTLRMITQIRRIIKNESIDVTLYGYVLYGLIGVLLQMLNGSAYGVAVFGMDILKLNRFFITRWLVKLILVRADLVISSSEYMKKLLIELGVPARQIKIVYPGVDERYCSGDKEPGLMNQHRLHGRHVLLTLGRLVRRKGFDMVLKAMPIIRQHIPEAVYMIVGAGSQREELEKLAASEGIEEHVIFAGAVADERIADYYNLCDVFVMPSRYLSDEGDVEGFGIVYLEAALCRKPVIGGRSGGVVEAILDEETGLLVDPESPDAIAQAVIRLYHDRQLVDRLTANGFQRASTQFNYRNITCGFNGFDDILSALWEEKQENAVHDPSSSRT